MLGLLNSPKKYLHVLEISRLGHLAREQREVHHLFLFTDRVASIALATSSPPIEAEA
jgi:hypothetical protein